MSGFQGIVAASGERLSALLRLLFQMAKNGAWIDADALAPGIHVIELVVAEKQGFAPDNANVILPHRSLLLGFDGTTLKIVVEVKPSNASQCDRNAPLRSPPLIRICPQ